MLGGLLGGVVGRSAAQSPLTFEKDIRPLLKSYCLDCHGGGEKLHGNLDLRLKRFAEKGGDSGEVIVGIRIRDGRDEVSDFEVFGKILEEPDDACGADLFENFGLGEG